MLGVAPMKKKARVLLSPLAFFFHDVYRNVFCREYFSDDVFPSVSIRPSFCVGVCVERDEKMESLECSHSNRNRARAARQPCGKFQHN